MGSKVYLPYVAQGTDGPTGQGDLAAAFVALWLAASWQERRGCVPDTRLMAAAQSHADWLAEHNAATHIGKDGLNANDRVRQSGYILPDFYLVGQNNVESACVDWEGPEKWLERLYASSYHHDHVAGVGFFRDQTVYGVACAASAWLVLLTAPPIVD